MTDRGPDPINRWLGETPRVRTGRRFGDTDEFLAELDEVISPTWEFPYDGRYRRRYTVDPLDGQPIRQPERQPERPPMRHDGVTRCRCLYCRLRSDSRRSRNWAIGAFYEDDEPVQDVTDAFDDGDPVVTAPPDRPRTTVTAVAPLTPAQWTNVTGGRFTYTRDEPNDTGDRLARQFEYLEQGFVRTADALRLTGRVVVQVNADLTQLSNAIFAIHAMLPPAEGRDAANRWADDGGAIGVVDY